LLYYFVPFILVSLPRITAIGIKNLYFPVGLAIPKFLPFSNHLWAIQIAGSSLPIAPMAKENPLDEFLGTPFPKLRNLALMMNLPIDVLHRLSATNMPELELLLIK